MLPLLSEETDSPINIKRKRCLDNDILCRREPMLIFEKAFEIVILGKQVPVIITLGRRSRAAGA